MSAVLAVVLMVLKIIGMILLALLLLLLLALLLPAGIHFRWSHIGGLRLQLCYGPLHFTLYPRKADEEEKKAEPKAETKQGNTPKTEPTSAAPPKPTPPPAKAELPAQPTMEKQTEPTEAKPAKAPEEPQKAEPAPPAEKEQGKPKAPETSPQPEQAVPKPKAKSAPAAETPAAEPQPEEDTGLVDRIKAAVRADPVGYVRHLFSVLRASVGPLLRGFRVSKLNVIWTITGETAAETSWQSHRTTLKYRRISSGWRLITPAAPNSSVWFRSNCCSARCWHWLQWCALCGMPGMTRSCCPQNTPNTIHLKQNREVIYNGRTSD